MSTTSENSDIYQAVLNDIVDEELSHPEIETLLRNNSEQFDLMIVEYLTPVLFALSEHFKCPYITISSLELSTPITVLWETQPTPFFIPMCFFFPFWGEFEFQGEVFEYPVLLYGFYRNLAHDNSKEEALVKNISGERGTVFGGNNEKNQFRFEGYSFDERKALPKDICEFLDIGEQGVIYFSLGTNVKSHHVNGNLLRAVIETFEELPYKILWKFEMEVPMKSKNVKIMKWVPQQDVLHHKNVKLFITQGGAQSMEEAIFAGVPLLVIPFVSDQKMNAHKVEANGLGLTIDKNTVTKKIFEAHILEIMTNSSFKESVERQPNLGRRTNDRFGKKQYGGRENVIRHKGVKHFGTPA
ncbi:hypothetical protein JTB14_001749 [Gonioctena quinquepunctata]|nr:hypothetical protein JTB14_001749 [Gonioctena quinquepunctata]